MNNKIPSADEWLREAKKELAASNCGMYLLHSGVVRKTAKASVRCEEGSTEPVIAMEFSYDKIKADYFINETRKLEGIYYVKTWLNEGTLYIGDDIMMVLIGGDIRPHVVDALQFLVGKLKNECVIEKELYAKNGTQ